MGLKELREKLKWLDPFTYVDLWVMPRVNPNDNEAVSWIVYLVFAFVFAWLFYNALGIALGTASPMVIVLSGSMEPLYHRGDVVVMQHVAAEQIDVPAVELGSFTTLEAEPLQNYAQTLCAGSAFQGLVECSEYRRLLQQGKVEKKDFAVREVVFQDSTIEIGTQGPVVVYHSTAQDIPIIHRVVALLRAQNGWYVLTKGDNREENPLLDQEAGISSDAIAVKDLRGKAILWIPFVGCFKLWLIDDLGSLIATGQLPGHFSGVC